MTESQSANSAWWAKLWRRLAPYDYIRIPTAILLLAAAGLKLKALLTGGAPLDLASASGPTGWLQVGAIPIEMAVAALLLVNRWHRVAWALTFALFATFAVFSATGIAAGIDSCGCFGEHSPTPTTALGLDLFVIFALVMVRPASSAARWRWLAPTRRVVLVGSVGAFLLGWQGAAYQMPRPLDVDAKYLDIGEQWEQENFALTWAHSHFAVGKTACFLGLTLCL